jgi:hypothetical protein
MKKIKEKIFLTSYREVMGKVNFKNNNSRVRMTIYLTFRIRKKYFKGLFKIKKKIFF